MSNGMGKDAYFKFPNKSGSATDYSAYVTKVTFHPSVQNPESTTFTSQAKTRSAGLKDSSISVEGFADTASGAIIEALYAARGQSKAVVAGPEGSTTGKPRVSGNYILRDLHIKPNINGVVPFTAQFDGDDAYTKDVFP